MAKMVGAHAQGVKILEEGDIYFVYQPRVQHGAVKGLQDVQRFKFILHPGNRNRYRVVVVGEKKMAEMTGGSSSARKNWSFVQTVARSTREIEREFADKKYETKTRGKRKKPAARPAGEGVYAIVRHDDHTHLVYALELPKKPGKVQHELDIEAEASYLVSVKNPEKSSPRRAGLSAGQKAEYPKRLQERFKDRRFIPVDPPDFLNYEGAELLLIGASEDLSEELGVRLEKENENRNTAEIFKDLRMRRSEHPVKPLFEGEWA